VAVTEGQLGLRLRDFARWAYLFLNDGKSLSGQQVVPAAFIRDIVTPREELRSAWRLGDYAEMFPEGQYRNQTYVLDAACSDDDDARSGPCQGRTAEAGSSAFAIIILATDGPNSRLR